MFNEKELELKERELALKERELGLKQNGSKGSSKWKIVIILIILLFIFVIGIFLFLVVVGILANQKPSTGGVPVPAANTKKTETVKANSPKVTNGCPATTVVNFKKGSSGQTFKCQMSGNSGQHKYFLTANEGQMFYIQFAATGAGSAPYAVYKVVDPNGGLQIVDSEGNSQGALDKTGKYTVIVDLSSSAKNPSAEYTITFSITARDGS